ncbi:flap endonuclease-1 [Candidatus Woesearchaeota archaeon]|jgi:flap endonuclease-1|nr:flap endonuclease-1 [Candidatus Woesearchaeota archaeon]
MGIAIKDILISKEISIPDLRNKTLAVDSFNMLYQFLTTIRARDGSLLTNQNGDVTSHLIGLFSRVTNMMEQGLKLAFVFDGTPPQLKRHEQQRRAELKKEAKKEYEIAKQREDIDGMRKYASRTTKLTKDMVSDAKELISYLGLPIIQAKSEGEAQAAYLVKQKHAFATISQDFDTLLHGSDYLVRNLSIAGKRKRTNKLGYITVKPELINLSDNLNHLGVDQDQLIALSMLIGTDYNIGGIKGIGPKKAITLVKQHNKDYNEMFKSVKWNDYFDYDWEDVFYLIKNIPIEKNFDIKFTSPDFNKITEFLCEKHGFEKERVEKTLNKIANSKDIKQKGLGDFF